ncbi:adenylyltransferase/cytidyltransferase family protein [Hymenobacter sp. BRD67]|uniref:adenylyltransferase/cytidyltransferase family protein n=1 Tax=Hymenobacter sp. BRD67 TaxID=2675877 RepID=UPI0015675CA4|nr:adenylyltransferase/cytidyltransferase family protein [Hymenobacter sp. BRD67]QKG52611.1 adenylyltransferase/cytidyltransferase family protein [Hymenobacter sp. BRD67]
MPFSLGLVVGKFWPPHQGHQLLLETAAAQVAELLVLVYANPDDPAHPAPSGRPGCASCIAATTTPRVRALAPRRSIL